MFGQFDSVVHKRGRKLDGKVTLPTFMRWNYYKRSITTKEWQNYPKAHDKHRIFEQFFLSRICSQHYSRIQIRIGCAQECSTIWLWNGAPLFRKYHDQIRIFIIYKYFDNKYTTCSHEDFTCQTVSWTEKSVYVFSENICFRLKKRFSLGNSTINEMTFNDIKEVNQAFYVVVSCKVQGRG